MAGEEAEETVLFRDRRTGEERSALVRASPSFDPKGRVQFVVNIFHDITARRRQEEAQRFLVEAGDILASSPDYRATLARVARLAVEGPADWCWVDLLEDDGSISRITTAAGRRSDASPAGWLREGSAMSPKNPVVVQGVLRTGRAELHPELSGPPAGSAVVEPELRILGKELGLTSAMIVPLRSPRGEPMGAITFASDSSGRRYGPEDLDMAEQLASRASLAVHGAMLFRQRDEIARVLQQSLIPPDVPVIPGMELARRYHAAGEAYEVGGDFYDVFETGDGGWGATIGDVCGKGPLAAAVTGLARHTIRAAAMGEGRPSNLLSALNEAVLRDGPDHMFCTACYVRLRPAEGGTRLTVCCAGHPPPRVLRSDGRVEAAGQPGTLLGVFPDPSLTDEVVDLRAGDALVLYTDGVTDELRADDRLGIEVLDEILGSRAGEDAEALAEAIDHAVRGPHKHPPRDDVAILVMRVRP